VDDAATADHPCREPGRAGSMLHPLRCESRFTVWRRVPEKGPSATGLCPGIYV
jgi:hypothetical protein